MKHTVRIEEVIAQLSLNWLVGDVRLHHHDHPYVLIKQTTNHVFPHRYLLHHQVRGDRLVIQDKRKRAVSLGLHLHKTDLEIYLPRTQLQSLSIHCKGANLFLDGLKVKEANCQLISGKSMFTGEIKHLRLQTVGGFISSQQLNTQTLSLRTTSSKVEMAGAFSDIDLNLIGRRVQIHSKTMLHSLKAMSTGSFVKVAIPENDGFICYVKKRSGTFHNDFPCVDDQERMVYKNGGKSFEVDIRGGSFLLSDGH
ncbi:MULTISPECIES: DUF4097 family beta strand repeat-containing protein [Bacillus]|uniref:DUF4097 family beta strand repeat-containing protein n=1 Tax=Bacillus TaxID=1386 RepID=UPI000764BC59|nr:DUF4097 family beta strand repeat-containing protein [Bacillus altitudinis]WOQ73357.1 DUF4097 family beta strand repeat-containing protein [Bacillus stratosphericus]APP14805.1 hypothetical protein BS467_03165 [Bacillus altitudinis]MBG9902468.1 hypothetical protein [Bacillus altitudinis]MBL7244646.1 DUF4097 family beta strand repeat protein [Bacillus altitudinis]USK24657.1 DUF4097 domain-containing protein [Bacillus altitudinis]